MLTVKQAIEVLKTMPQDAQLMIERTDDCGCLFGPASVVSIHVQDSPSKHRDVHLTTVVIANDTPYESPC